MVYIRDHSIEIEDKDYENYFGSINDAKNECFNIGAGKWAHKAWTNIDLPPQTEEFKKIQAPCVFHDLVKNNSLPIKNNQASLIYTSHVIEHLPDPNVEAMFMSVYKSLKNGGIFRVVTGPDADTDFEALIRQDKNWWYFYEKADFSNSAKKSPPMSLEEKWLYHLATPRSLFSDTYCDKKYSRHDIVELIKKYSDNPNKIRNILTKGLQFNVNFPGNHLSWWSTEKLLNKLKSAGFKNVKKSAYGQSQSYFMRDMNFFDQTYPQISLYIEGIK